MLGFFAILFVEYELVNLTSFLGASSVAHNDHFSSQLLWGTSVVHNLEGVRAFFGCPEDIDLWTKAIGDVVVEGSTLATLAFSVRDV